jgi:hypothetical protein
VKIIFKRGDGVASLQFATRLVVIPAKLAIASASQNPGNEENWITAFAVMTKWKRQLIR